jgi:arsenite methyltransferase
VAFILNSKGDSVRVLLAVNILSYSNYTIYTAAGIGSTSSRDDIASRLPLLIQDLRKRSLGCLFMHGSTLGKRILYLGDTCCLHEAFMSCSFAKQILLIGEIGHSEGMEESDEAGLVAEVQKLIPGWCSSLGLPTPNLEVVLGSALSFLTESSGVEPGSRDIIVGCNVFKHRSKEQMQTILANTYNALAHGGEFTSTEVFSDRRIPPHALHALHQMAALHAGARGDSGCGSSYSPNHDQYQPAFGGNCSSNYVTYVGDFKRIAATAGFLEPRILHVMQQKLPDAEAQAALGNARIYRATVRMFKVPPGLIEPTCEDYGQVAVYRGTIPQCESEYKLDVHHVFQLNQPKLVCGNTAAMLGEGGFSWLHPHFHIQGDRSVHFGLFSGSGLLDIFANKDKCCG